VTLGLGHPDEREGQQEERERRKGKGQRVEKIGMTTRQMREIG
jgi:hypothetical protein